jgi:hypothetical protein
MPVYNRQPASDGRAGQWAGAYWESSNRPKIAAASLHLALNETSRCMHMPVCKGAGWGLTRGQHAGEGPSHALLAPHEPEGAGVVGKEALERLRHILHSHRHSPKH